MRLMSYPVLFVLFALVQVYININRGLFEVDKLTYRGRFHTLHTLVWTILRMKAELTEK
jgi:hypothetical protein